MVAVSEKSAMSVCNDSISSTMDVEAAVGCGEKKCKRLDNRVLHFNLRVQVRLIPHRRDLSSEELSARWLDREDFEDFQVENDLTEAVLQSEDQKHLVDDELLCSRGVLDLDTLETRAESNTFIKQLVLNQFSFLAQQGAANIDITVAKVYHDMTKSAAQKAHKLALQDEEDADQYNFRENESLEELDFQKNMKVYSDSDELFPSKRLSPMNQVTTKPDIIY